MQMCIKFNVQIKMPKYFCWTRRPHKAWYTTYFCVDTTCIHLSNSYAFCTSEFKSKAPNCCGSSFQWYHVHFPSTHHLKLTNASIITYSMKKSTDPVNTYTKQTFHETDTQISCCLYAVCLKITNFFESLLNKKLIDPVNMYTTWKTVMDAMKVEFIKYKLSEMKMQRRNCHLCAVHVTPQRWMAVI